MIPTKEEYLEDIKGSLERYLNHGIPCGSFLNAVLANDLFTAIAHADEISLIYLPEVVRYIYCFFPSDATGSYTKVNLYIQKIKSKNL